MSSTVRAAVMKAPGVLEVERFPMPDPAPGALVMKVPTMHVTTINKVTCLQYFENMVFDLNNSCSNVRTILDSFASEFID